MRTSKTQAQLKAIVTLIFVIGSKGNFVQASSSGVGISSLEEKVCIGTNGRMSVPSNRSHHYRNLKDRYTNCTYVEGNLELTWIQDPQMDLSFLQHIREVSGYVLISHVDVRRIVLPSLQVIRGRTRFRLNVHDDEFALIITLSRMHDLEFPALRDVLAGNVGVLNNYNLCQVKTINWDEIISGVTAEYVYVYNFTQEERKCPPCDSSCEAGCWGEGPHNCQKFSKINCSQQCHEGRCYGKQPRQCCHLSCAGGCTGPRKSDCLACEKFNDDGECKDECPSLVIYNSNTNLSRRNPNGKYAYGATCVKECPEHLLRDAGSGTCVRSCPPDKEQSPDGECVPCSGPCGKKCQGPPNTIIHSGNINNFRNCTIIEGSIQILETSFNGFQEVHQNYTFGERYKPMDPSQLEVFSTLKEITGYINLQAPHPNFTDLSCFRNLETIGGRDKAEFFSALYIVKTSLRSLNLRALKRIRSGTVAILENPDLCFASNINWRKILSSKANEQISGNMPQDRCTRTGQVCSPQCSSDGCWGAEARDCLSCANFKLDDQCVPNCNAETGVYEESNGICKHCHEQCMDFCTGGGPGNCTRCKNVKDGPFCVKSCPPSKFNLSGECFPCHPNCAGGCNGPESTITDRGCKSCRQAIVDKNTNTIRCLPRGQSCPIGYYNEFVNRKEKGRLRALAGKSLCTTCPTQCTATSPFP